MYENKIKSRSEIKKIVEDLRKNNPKIRIVTTNGAFDIVHVGHVMSLVKAKSYGDILIIGLNSDSSIKKYKSKDRPINPQEDRAIMLAALECVDYVTIFDETDPREFLKVIKPNFHVKSKSGYKGLEEEVVKSNVGKIVLLDDIAGKSTTLLIDKIIKLYQKENKK